MKLQVVNDGGEMVREIQTGTNFLVLYNGNDGVEYDRQALRSARFDDKHILKQEYGEIAKKLAAK